MENTDEPMEGTDDEEAGGGAPADGRGDEGGGESLPPMTKLQQHASCNTTYNRQLVGRILVEVFRGAVETGTELNVDEVMQPVLKLVNDTDTAVRIDLVEQLPHVAMICQEAPDRLGDVLPRHLIQIISTFLHDVDQQVRQSTHTALLALIDRGLLDKNSAEYVIAPTLLRMSQQIERLEVFTLAIDGMSKVARILDEETAERLFLNRFLELCTASNFFIRKLCAIRFGEFSAAMSKDAIYDKLLSMYVHLCEDTVWSVRKSCADVIVPFGCCVSLHHRRAILSDLLANFLTDDSKWVKVSAFQILGPFISTFAKQFTGFSYNQYGEFVLTDQNGTELRYNVFSFAGSAEPPVCKAVLRNGQIVHFYEEDGNSISKTNQDSNRADANKENASLNDRTKTWIVEKQWNDANTLNFDNQYNDAAATHDYDQFNPFRYYYIPPDLPLDTELVEAAVIEKSGKWPSSEAEGQSESYESNSEPTKLSKVTSDEEDERETPETDSEPTKPLEWPNEELSSSILNNEKNNEKSENRLKNNDTNDTNERSKSDVAVRFNSLPPDSRRRCSKLLINDNNKSNTSNSSLCNNSDVKNFANYCDDPSDHSEASTKIDRATVKTGQTIVPDVLVNFFISMADPNAKCIGIEIPHHCAFSFPAVALTLGRENWPLLKTAYEELAFAREYRVRRTMASSIHELAMILGEEITARDLLPIYDGFIKDLDEVRIGALKHLTAFLKVLRPADRQLFLPRLKEFLIMDNEWNWRFREEVASRLREAIPLFSPKDVSDDIAPLSFPLLIDKVAAVRHTALALVTEIISYLSTDEQLVTTLIRDLKDLLASEPSKWTRRQTLALLCSSLISNQAISAERFGKELLPCLLGLSSDVVPNVRLAVVTALSRHVFNICDQLGVELAEKVNQKLIQMRTDPDRDVRIVAGGIAGKYYPQGAEWKVPAFKSKFSWYRI